MLFSIFVSSFLVNYLNKNTVKSEEFLVCSPQMEEEKQTDSGPTKTFKIEEETKIPTETVKEPTNNVKENQVEIIKSIPIEEKKRHKLVVEMW